MYPVSACLLRGKVSTGYGFVLIRLAIPPQQFQTDAGIQQSLQGSGSTRNSEAIVAMCGACAPEDRRRRETRPRTWPSNGEKLR